jgi:hypothetical protein
MRELWLVLLLSGSFALAQESKPTNPSQQKPKDSKGEITVQGCVGTSSGDYVLARQDPVMTYELEATGKIKLRKYLGQLVQVRGKESPSLSTSSDILTRSGSPSAVTLTITSIKTISKQCPVQLIPDQ